MKEFCVQTKKIDLCPTYKIQQGATSEDKAYAATYTMVNKMPVGASLAWRVWEKPPGTGNASHRGCVLCGVVT